MRSGRWFRKMAKQTAESEWKDCTAAEHQSVQPGGMPTRHEHQQQKACCPTCLATHELMPVPKAASAEDGMASGCMLSSARRETHRAGSLLHVHASPVDSQHLWTCTVYKAGLNEVVSSGCNRLHHAGRWQRCRRMLPCCRFTAEPRQAPALCRRLHLKGRPAGRAGSS